MTHNLCNHTAYIACDSTDSLVACIAALCENEGMQRVPERQGKLHHSPALACNNWSLSVHRGMPGWHVIDSVPWDLLSDRAKDSHATRLFDLCARLSVGGFSLHISDGGPWGEVLLETDGKGQQRVSGYWSDEGIQGPMNYLGIPLDKERVQMRFELLDSLQTLLEDGRDGQKCGIHGDYDTERACEHIARQLGTANGDPWWEWTTQPGSSVVLHFTWPARDRPEPPATARELAMEEFNRAPRYFYADGSPIVKGDAVLFGGGRFPGLVTGFLTGWDARGNPYAAAVLVNDGKPGDRAVGVESPTGGKFAELHFVERSSADYVRAGVDYLRRRATQGEAAAQFSLGNLYVTGVGVTQDRAQGLAWWRKAADQGDALAQHCLGHARDAGGSEPVA